MKTTYCAACNATEELQHHHLTPISKGGEDIEVNIITLCTSCHSKIHGYSNDIWQDHTQMILDKKREQKENGQFLGGQAPYGYTVLVKDGLKFLQEDAEEQKVIKIMKYLRDKDYTYTEITAELTSNGYFTRKGNVFASMQIKRSIEYDPGLTVLLSA